MILLDMLDFSVSKIRFIELDGLEASPLVKLAVIFGSKDASCRLGEPLGDIFVDIDGD